MPKVRAVQVARTGILELVERRRPSGMAWPPQPLLRLPRDRVEGAHGKARRQPDRLHPRKIARKSKKWPIVTSVESANWINPGL
jgi:hypothetical protein